MTGVSAEEDGLPDSRALFLQPCERQLGQGYMMQAYDPDLEADCQLGDLSPTQVCRRRPDDALLLLGEDRGGDGSRQNKGKRVR